ncbi:MAG: acetylglutamate kinase [Planctomycetota bacterium]
MDDAIIKADALVEALGYIQRFHGKTIVVKVGGSVLDDDGHLSSILTDVGFMRYVGMQPIVVHGGGKAINAAMNEAGLEPQMVQGRRYTDDRTLAIVEHVLCNVVNAQLVSFLNSQGVEAMGLHSLASPVLQAQKMLLPGDGGRQIDIGFVGEVTDVNRRLLELLVKANSVPVIASVARDPGGGALNVNADTAAGAVAAAMRADKFVCVSDTHGIRANPDDPDSVISSLTLAEVEGMKADGTISAGMLPKVEACVTALHAGVKKAHIIDGRIPHALLLEIYTDAGIGTQITL